MSYDAHENLVAPARPSSDPVRLAAGAGLAIVAFIFLQIVYISTVRGMVSPDRWTTILDEIARAHTPQGALITLFQFTALIGAVWLPLWLVHNRPLLSTIGPLPLALRQFARVFAALAALNLVLGILPMPDTLAPVPNLDPGQWLALLPLALCALLVQTGSEEIAFRGYLQSQLAARFSHPAVWLGLPSAAFALLHYAPSDMGQNAWAAVIWAMAFGIVAGDLTARSGTLGPAIAMHMMNNIGAILIAAPRGYFDGLALYTYPFSLDEPGVVLAWAPVDLMVLLCSWLAARLALRR